ncbi:hypothetical protein MGG_15958 [Pyricularia oryzae 70-15]|uniref:Uncharacterized protein n=1 Tax=Pyricularia oryzae (strain 70-15 / ATCC MYA-4617 / FGSC 8958) TaxID=242507 RepID=G4MXA0_PYRO7|nr:uncharacterized protein MGG_15958 [Pyricularia oryzae 70-15]EHA55998.1 hypothetical protein MGG_15958 [Pyricularia oryzae 70-15]KAI7912437.1 hypothetical protein M9X92_010024 [Pyricularia oryzae]KAI7913381.1 hypothetical protein M0657_010053 [Pyricularia oryzae]
MTASSRYPERGHSFASSCLSTPTAYACGTRRSRKRKHEGSRVNKRIASCGAQFYTANLWVVHAERP